MKKAAADMEILCHRGLWGGTVAQNSEDAFKGAFDNGWGLETDVRDHNGRLVISHDMPHGNCYGFEDLLKLYQSRKSDALLAINIKADGLAGEVKRLLTDYKIKNYFCFDMSVPDTRAYKELGIRFASRFSDVEPVGGFEEEAQVIWIDNLRAPYIDLEALPVDRWQQKTALVFVSPELHKRDPKPFWRDLKIWLNSKAAPPAPRIYICVDQFFDAQRWFSDGTD